MKVIKTIGSVLAVIITLFFMGLWLYWPYNALKLGL